MNIKFRITKDQLNYAINAGLPYALKSGYATYRYNKEHNIYIANGFDNVMFQSAGDNFISNSPLIIITENAGFNVFLDENLNTLHKVINPDKNGIIAIFVLLHDKTIESVNVLFSDDKLEIIKNWALIGNDVLFSFSNNKTVDEKTQLRTIQTFGEGTVNILSSLSVGVVGASGTGSPLIEMLFRTGIGELVLIDPDIVEHKNINRILNVGINEVKNSTKKVDALKTAIKTYGFDTEIEAISLNLFSKEAVSALSRCDFIFGCTDTADSRALLNDICIFYCIPYIDVGVHLNADGKGNVSKVCFTVNYVQPNGTTLIQRKSITEDEVYSTTLKRINPEQYCRQIEEHYIKGVAVESPGVMCVNMAASSFAFLEFISRIHDIRSDGNDPFDSLHIDYTNMRIIYEDFPIGDRKNKNLGKGTVSPLLNKAVLS